jgi:hypothetical protein
MKALISTVEPRQTGYRVAQLSADSAIFPVSSEMFWVDFPANIEPALAEQDRCWYDPADETIKVAPQPEFPAEV